MHRKSVTLFILSVLFSTLSLGVHAKVFKIATLSPDGSSWMVIMKQAAKDIALKTDDRVKLKFYPGGVMGNDQAVFRKIRAGQLHGTATTGGAISVYYNDAQIYGLPVIFKNQEEVDYVRKRMDPQIMQGLEDNGFVSFGLADGGMAYVMSKAETADVDQLSTRKVWVPSDDKAMLETAQAFGIHPVPLNLGDVLTSLQSGLVDTVATSPIAAIALQWHTQVEYITDVPLIYLYALLAVDKKVFDKLSAPDQLVMRDIMGKAFAKIDQLNKDDNINALAALKNQGLKLLPPTDAQLQQWYKLAEHSRLQAIENGQVTQAGVDTATRYIEELYEQKSQK
ncbi:MAG: TRAP transporter substrate-binding protein DctP [Halioglobus sp.]